MLEEESPLSAQVRILLSVLPAALYELTLATIHDDWSDHISDPSLWIDLGDGIDGDKECLIECLFDRATQRELEMFAILSDDEKYFFRVKYLEIALMSLEATEVMERYDLLGEEGVSGDVCYLHRLEMNTIVSILPLL